MEETQKNGNFGIFCTNLGVIILEKEEELESKESLGDELWLQREEMSKDNSKEYTENLIEDFENSPKV